MRVIRKGARRMRLKTGIVVATAAAALMLGAAGGALAAEDGPYPVWWSPELELESLDGVDERLARKLWLDGGEIEVSKGAYDTAKSKIVDTCVLAIELSKMGYWGRGNHTHQVLMLQLAKCQAIEMLKRARPAQVSYVRNFVLDHDALNYLPAMVEVGPGCDWLCRQSMANERRIPWSQFVEIVSAEIISGRQMEVVTLAWSTTIKILARADFNADGLENLLVWSNTDAIGGTWGATEVYLLTRDSPDGVFWVLGADKYLCNPEEYQCESHYDYPKALR